MYEQIESLQVGRVYCGRASQWSAGVKHVVEEIVCARGDRCAVGVEAKAAEIARMKESVEIWTKFGLRQNIHNRLVEVCQHRLLVVGHVVATRAVHVLLELQVLLPVIDRLAVAARRAHSGHFEQVE